VHAVNALVDLAGIGVGPDATGLIGRAMQAIAEEGRGVLVLIRDLRPRSISEWIERETEPSAGRQGTRERRQVEIGIGSQILKDLGVGEMVLMTNSPAHVYTGVEAFGLAISGTRRIG